MLNAKMHILINDYTLKIFFNKKELFYFSMTRRYNVTTPIHYPMTTSHIMSVALSHFTWLFIVSCRFAFLPCMVLVR